MTILSATKWPTNAHLIEDVAKLGYLDGRVLDTTYGINGTFWKRWMPSQYTFCDGHPGRVPPGGQCADFRKLPFEDRSFDAVVFDPPYKLNGTPTEAVDNRYGVHVPSRWQDRMELMLQGFTECCRVSRRYVLAKCMDQVVSGHKVWQTYALMRRAEEIGYVLEDRFDMLVTPRPQPPGRRQVHSQGNYSTLLVFRAASGTRRAGE